jgi:hypothetical protein
VTIAPRPRPVRVPEPGWLTLAVLAVALVLFAIVAYGRNLRLTFVGDDYVFLERVLREPLSAVASRANVDFGWYRPWSRDFHFWVLTRILHLSSLGFRIVAIGLWATALTLYFSISSEIVPQIAATIATFGAATLALWGTPLLWISGSQDLWMLVFALAALKLHARRHSMLAGIAVGLALLSKETAAMIPLLLLAWSLVIERLPAPAAVR